MENSLSVIMPVKNSSHQLVERVEAVLEIMSDISTNFEIAIVDDGSTDQTKEVGKTLAMMFPQVRLFSHNQTRGILASVKTGLEGTDAINIIIQAQSDPISPTRMRGEWINRDEVLPHINRAVPSEKKSLTKEDKLIERLEKWRENLVKNKAKICLDNEPTEEIVEKDTHQNNKIILKPKMLRSPNFIKVN